MGRDRLGWQNIVLWRRDDAGDALRGGPHHAGALNEMVLAQGLGGADRQAPRDEKGNRSPGPSASRDHAPYVGGRHRVPLDPGTGRGSSMTTVQDQR